MDLKLAGKRVLVTGSTSGIGKAIAARYLHEGAVVYINGRSVERCAEAAARLAAANVLSAVRLSRALLPAMLERDYGRIVNISSECAIKPLGQMVHYSVTKTALLSLSRALAELTKGRNVTVNSVLPGPTWTDGVPIGDPDLWLWR